MHTYVAFLDQNNNNLLHLCMQTFSHYFTVAALMLTSATDFLLKYCEL